MLKYCESNGIFVRSLGLDVTQQTLDNLLKTDEAFKDLGVTSSKALLQSDKAMLRLIVVLKNAQNSFGDINRTINTLSNQLRVFESSLSNLRLAIGDLFAEPFRNALIYINAFLIAITKIIRAFKPIATESETAGAGMQQFADDTEDAVDAATGGGNLDFDEFRVLSSGENEQVSITEAITAELQKQIDAYNEQISAMDEVSNKAVEIAENIRDWFIVVDKDGKFVEWTDNAKLLGGALTALIAIPIASHIYKFASSLVDLIPKISKAAVTIDTLTKASNLLRTSGVFLLAFSLFQLITNWDNLDAGMKAVYITLSILGAAFIVFSNTTILKTLVGAINKGIASFVRFSKNAVLAQTAIAGLGAAVGIGLFLAFKKMFDSMDSQSKVAAGLAVTLLGLAVAIGAVVAAMHGLGAPAVAAAILASIGVISAGIYGLTSGIQGLAEGGITDANFIMTHENGVREWVGRQGNSTAVVNDTQMSDVMGQAVRNGVLEALSYNTGNGETFNITVQANLDGQKVYESTKRIARRNGEKFARV